MLKSTKKADSRRKSPHCTKTPVKEEFGKRAAYARRIAGFDQEEAGVALGYTNGVHLSEIENGRRGAPPEVVPAMCRLYGVSADYLFAMSDSPELSTAEARLRLTMARLMADLPGVLQDAAARAVDAVREDTSPLLLADGLHRVVTELVAAVAAMRAAVTEFDEFKGGARVLTKMEAATEAAQIYLAARNRGRQLVEVRVRHQLDRVRLPQRRAPVPPQQLPLEPAKKVKSAVAA